MPDMTLQTGDGPDRLTGDREPGLAARLVKVLGEVMDLVDEIPEGDDLDGEAVLEAAELCAAAVRERWPDDGDLNTTQRAMVAQHRADDLAGRHEAVLTTTRRGPVVVGDVDMRLSRVERALMDLARLHGQSAVDAVVGHLYPDDRSDPAGQA